MKNQESMSLKPRDNRILLVTLIQNCNLLINATRQKSKISSINIKRRDKIIFVDNIR